MKRTAAAAILVLILAGSLAFFVRTLNAPPSISRRDSVGRAVPVTVAVAGERSILRAVTLVGVLRADHQVALSPRVPARIVELSVRNGQSVRQGQVLARLDSGGAREQVAGAVAAATAAEAQARKADAGRRARAAEMDAQLQQALGGLRTAQARLRQAELGVPLARSEAASDAQRASSAVKQAEAGLRQAEAGLKQAEDGLSRVRFLYQHGGVPRADVDGAEAQADIARAQRDAALAALEQARSAAGPAAEAAPLRAQVSQAELDAARAGVRQAEDAVRAARRARGGALQIASRDVEAARAQAAQARAGASQARAQVGSDTLTSPLDGIVTDLSARVGEMAQPGMAVMSVVAPQSTVMEASAPARYAALLRPGQSARVTSDTRPNSSLAGEVVQVMPVASADSRSVQVRILLRNPPPGVTPGAMATAVVDLAQADHAVSIPVDALRSEGNVTYVYVVENGRAVRRDLATGAVDGAYQQVVSGLRAGEVVVLSGPSTLAAGAPVQVVGR